MSSLGEAAAAWRDCTTVKEFCEKYRLLPLVEKSLSSYHQSNQLLSSELLEYMSSYLNLVQGFPRVRALALDREYFRTASNSNHEDALMKIFISCLQETGKPYPSHDIQGDVANVLKTHVSRRKNPAQKDFEDAQKKVEPLRKAFHTEEKGKANVSEALWEKICSYYSQYDPAAHFSPYTSIVGPSGIGKSFSIQSIARKGLAYVVYASLSQPLASSYPGRSYLDRYLTSRETSYYYEERAEMTTQFETFIAASIRQVQLCCRHNISPSDYFTMQVYDDSEHRSIHMELLAALKSLLRRTVRKGDVKRAKMSSNRGGGFRSIEYRDSFDDGEYIDDEMAEYEKKIEPFFKEYAQGSKDGRIPDAAERKPYILFCIDEARSLLTPSDLAFLSFRRAARNQQIRGQSRGIQKQESFFFVLLDTCAKFNVFVPPQDFDPSAKLTGDPREQFTPIWEISSHDNLAIGPHTIKDLSTIKIDYNWEKRLFTFGRPNWAVQLQIGGIQGLIHHATLKMYGGTNKKELTEEALTSILAFRLQFSIVSHHLGKSLVSGYLRMVYDMSDDRLRLRTIQPSEPILAWVAYREMETRPSCRLEVLKNFYKQCSSGSIDAGDIGEMAAALILMFAFDKTQSLDLATPKPQNVLEFVQTLFGASRTKNLSSELSSGQTGKHVVRLMEKGSVFFNHFTRSEGAVYLSVLRQAWGRGTALFSYPGTAYFDIIIPVAILEDNKMSFIVIQVKNRQGDRLTDGLKTEADIAISRAAQALPKTSAYMGILMALRTDGKREVNIAVESSKKRTRSQDDKRRVMVVAVGLDHNIYPGMGSDTKEGKEICKILQHLLDLKGNIHGSKETEYQKNLAVGFKED